MKHVGQSATGRSGTATRRTVGFLGAGDVGRVGRVAAAGSLTSKPRLRRISAAPLMPAPNSSEVASRPVAYR